MLNWQLPVIDASTKNGSLEFTIPGMPGDFFPVRVSFVSTKPYCNVGVSYSHTHSMDSVQFSTLNYTLIGEMKQKMPKL